MVENNTKNIKYLRNKTNKRYEAQKSKRWIGCVLGQTHAAGLYEDNNWSLPGTETIRIFIGITRDTVLIIERKDHSKNNFSCKI